ncbi:MAG TPA: 2-dehydropantoate 2-reductase N-terminal domain-containing protein, partial [Anaerolineales bacterium]|nr:2-dehydropantoate 2-reductase N-terminal domain-containing protein [Anaerolineales bacterium]
MTVTFAKRATVTFLDMNDNILIVGTGALACLFAARLTQAGQNILMLGTWKEGLDALRSNGA